MDFLRTSIFATILYYDVFNLPLTFAEVYKFLINPARFSTKNVQVKSDMSEIFANLINMSRSGIIEHKNGFYFMPGKEYLYEERIVRDKTANKKWKKFLATVKYLQLSPYLRAVFLSGSLAANNPEPKSDFDVFIVIKSGRLYTSRFFLWLISSVLGARRGRYDRIAPDKLCFNHYVTDDNLEISHRGLYIAQALSNMKPVIDFCGIASKFCFANKWANAYCFNFAFTEKYREIKKNKIMAGIAKLGETILDNLFGDLLEKILSLLQQRRIKINPLTYASGGRVVFTDKELEFHPRSFEKIVIDKYNDGIKKMGIWGVVEKDSGLS